MAYIWLGMFAVWKGISSIKTKNSALHVHSSDNEFDTPALDVSYMYVWGLRGFFSGQSKSVGAVISLF